MMKAEKNNEEQLVKALETVDAALAKLRNTHADIFAELIDLVERRNEIVATMRDLVKTRAETTHEPASLGPFRASPVIVTDYDLDALEQILTDDEFDQVVRIEYKLREGNTSRRILGMLEQTRYPEIARYKRSVVFRTTVAGPKEMDIGELVKE